MIQKIKAYIAAAIALWHKWTDGLFDFKTGLKHWSTWFWAAAITMLALAIEAPNFILTYLPQFIPNLPQGWQQDAAIVLGIAGFVSKAILQNGVKRRIDKFRTWLASMRDNVSGEVKQTVAKAGGWAAVIAVAGALALPVLKHDEGLVLRNYKDVAGYVTACYGHRVYGKPLQSSYTEEQCSDLLNDDFGSAAYQVLQCAPNLATDTSALAGWSRFEFNTGAFCSSKPTMVKARRLIAAGQIKASCAQMSPWVYAGGQKRKGLVKRRASERAMCEDRS